MTRRIDCAAAPVALLRAAGAGRAWRFAAWVVLGLAASGPLQAADAPAKAQRTKYLTPEELRACLAQQTRVKDADDALPKQKLALATAHDELARRGEALKEKLDQLDRTDAAAVDAYNAQAQAHAHEIEALDARVSAFNQQVEAARVEREAFVKACGNRQFLTDDAEAIRKGR